MDGWQAITDKKDLEAKTLQEIQRIAFFDVCAEQSDLFGSKPLPVKDKMRAMEIKLKALELIGKHVGLFSHDASDGSGFEIEGFEIIEYSSEHDTSPQQGE